MLVQPTPFGMTGAYMRWFLYAFDVAQKAVDEKKFEHLGEAMHEQIASLSDKELTVLVFAQSYTVDAVRQMPLIDELALKAAKSGNVAKAIDGVMSLDQDDACTTLDSLLDRLGIGA